MPRNKTNLDQSTKETSIRATKQKKREKTSGGNNNNNCNGEPIKEMSNDNQQRASAIGRQKKKETKPKTKKKIQGRKKSKDEDQDMGIDDGNKEDKEALAAGRESNVYERMVMDEG
jgi:hypothetical protein